MISPANAFDIPAKLPPPLLGKSSIPHPPVLTIKLPFFRKQFITSY